MYLYISKLVFLFLFGFLSCSDVISIYGYDPLNGDLLTHQQQTINQTNSCEGNANCINQAMIRYFALADDGSFVTSTSNQTVTQLNQCSDANCNNNALMTNLVAGTGTAVINSDVTQNLEQTCSITSGNCNNFNELTVSATGSSGFLDYVATQNVQNTNQNNQGGTPAGVSQISYTVNPPPSPYTPQPVTQTGPGTITNPPE
jgi:hypothetical protein